MIKINGILIEQNMFPDSTPLIKLPKFHEDEFEILWSYDNMVELFNLCSIVESLRLHYDVESMVLKMPYVPNARQDRVRSNEDVFTLKTFCNIINNLKFNAVVILDAHSDVTPALLNNVISVTCESVVKQIVLQQNIDMVFYPDNGAVHKYTSYLDYPYAYGVKNRDWATGKILGLDIIGDVKDKSILFIDDIVAYGGSLYFSAKKLKELGAKNIYAYISHTENNFFDEAKGRAKDTLGSLVEKVYTTDSIYRLQKDNVEII